MTPADYERYEKARAKKARKLAQWLERNPNSSEKEAKRNPRHAKMLANTSGKNPIDIPPPSEPYPDLLDDE